jgi:hypothetical protein
MNNNSFNNKIISKMNNNSFNNKIKTIMNKSLNLNTMKNNYFKNTLKLGITAIFIMALGTANAQTSTTTNTNVDKGAGSIETVKLIDNKGTIKYLQSNNGITTITSTNSGSATTTTWQLGGALVDATTITTSPTGTFTIDGEEFNLTSTGSNTSVAANALDDLGTGFTLLVREEGTGRITKMLATELVSSIRVNYVQLTDNIIADQDINVSGLPALIGASQLGKLFVFRNGAKLRVTEDFVVSLDKITTNFVTIPLYQNDVIEIQYIK